MQTEWAEVARDEISRVLTLPDGRRLEASFFIRYFTPEELESVLERAGFSVLWVHGDLDGNPPAEALTDLIIGATKRD